VAGFSDFIAELKRRRVVRAVLGWGIFSFALLQIYEPVMHGLHLPEWTLTLVVVFLGFGFPATFLLAWIFDLGPRGIERTSSASGVAATPARRARSALLLIGVGLLFAVPGWAWYAWRDRARPGAGPAGGGATPLQGPAGTTAAPSIAVLPFADLSEKHDQEYFADGMSEEILNALAQVEGLHVAGRTSSFSFKGKGEDLRVIGQKLNVTAVLEGSVRKEDGRVRVVAQVVNVADGYSLWSRTFDRDLSGVLAVQDEIARAVVQLVEVRLLPGRGDALPRRPAVDPKAYDQYLLGRDYLRRGFVERNIRLAVEAFEKAVALDGGYAPAWAGLSRASLSLGDFAVTPAEIAEARRRPLAEAEKAMALDPGLPDGHLSRANARRFLAWDFAGAQADVERALALSHGDASANRERGLILLSLGRLPEAIASLRKAADLDPLDSETWVEFGMAHLGLGDTAGARAALERAREVTPDDPWAWSTLGIVSLLEGKPAEALAASARSPEEVWRIMGAALALPGLGQAAAAHEALDALTTRFARQAAYQIAEVHAWWGERDSAFEWLERAYRQHDFGLAQVKYDPLLGPLRGDPRYSAFLGKMNLPVD
jgi:serine/threonine-protein kinase